jgi:hypothetical protein
MRRTATLSTRETKVRTIVSLLRHFRKDLTGGVVDHLEAAVEQFSRTSTFRSYYSHFHTFLGFMVLHDYNPQAVTIEQLYDFVRV